MLVRHSSPKHFPLWIPGWLRCLRCLRDSWTQGFPAPSGHTHQGRKPQWGSGSGVSFQPQRCRCPLHLASRFELESSPDVPFQHVSSSSGILRFFLTHGPPHETTPTFLVDSNHVDSEKGNHQYLNFSSSTQTPDSSTTLSLYYHDQPCDTSAVTRGNLSFCSFLSISGTYSS